MLGFPFFDESPRHRSAFPAGGSGGSLLVFPYCSSVLIRIQISFHSTSGFLAESFLLAVFPFNGFVFQVRFFYPVPFISLAAYKNFDFSGVFPSLSMEVLQEHLSLSH